MLVTLNISNWQGQQRDKKKSQEVLSEENAQQDAGSWITRLISQKDLEGVSSAVNRSRAIHNSMTLPWNDSGTRILASSRFFEYRERMAKSRDEWQVEVDKFLAAFPTLIANAARRLGGLKANAKIPSVGELRNKFDWNYSFLPLPDTRDFRTDLQDDAAEEIRQNITSTLNDKMKEAVGDMYRRLAKRVTLVAKRTKDSDAILRSSIFEAVRELVADIPKMNITGDPELDAIGKEITAKLSVDPADLRDDKVKRARVAKDAGEILKRVQAYTGPVAAISQQQSQPAPKSAKVDLKPEPAKTKRVLKPAVVAPVKKKSSVTKPMSAAEIAKMAAAAS
jgi:hypothetical protein